MPEEINDNWNRIVHEFSTNFQKAAVAFCLTTALCGDGFSYLRVSIGFDFCSLDSDTPMRKSIVLFIYYSMIFVFTLSLFLSLCSSSSALAEIDAENWYISNGKSFSVGGGAVKHICSVNNHKWNHWDYRWMGAREIEQNVGMEGVRVKPRYNVQYTDAKSDINCVIHSYVCLYVHVVYYTHPKCTIISARVSLIISIYLTCPNDTLRTSSMWCCCCC